MNDNNKTKGWSNQYHWPFAVELPKLRLIQLTQHTETIGRNFMTVKGQLYVHDRNM